MLRREFRLLIAVATVLVAGACKGTTSVAPQPTLTFKTTLLPSNEVPPTTSNGSGTVTITVDSLKNLTYTVTFTGLTSGLTASHIHAPGVAGTNAGVVLGLTTTAVAGTTSGTFGPTTVNLTTALTGTIGADSLIKLMTNGNAYVNVHTTNNAGGEIRGWLAKQ
jgi:Cu/Zn superoxide dismutase